MLKAGLVVVSITILFLLGWTIALLVAKKNDGWIYETYQPKEPFGDHYLAVGSITLRPPTPQ